MEADDLNAPLGQSKKKNRLPKLPVAAPQMLAGALGMVGLVVVLWAAFVNDPLGGEPTAVVATKPAGAAPEVAIGDGKEQTGSQSYIPPDAKDDKALAMAGVGLGLDVVRQVLQHFDIGRDALGLDRASRRREVTRRGQP